MSSYIKVNYDQLENAASAIETYLDRQKKNMKKATDEVTTLKAFWKGSDYDSFVQKWNEMDNRDSTTKAFTKYLESYADVLKYSAKQYKKAQEKAINRANSL